MEKRFVYADNAATTKISKQVLEVMLPAMELYGNPSSLYALGSKSKQAIETARKQCADAIGADAKEIFFTSGGSEADNWAIKGAAARMEKLNKKHIISTAFEHHAVLHTLDALKKQGFEVTLLPVHENGIIRVDEFISALREDTGLVTIMFANNEIGTIQPIEQIGAICREKKIMFHVDAVQAVGNVHIDVKALNIDLMSVSGHKLHAPKGIGMLYIRKGVAIANLIDGGAQERGRRAGTENIASIVGFGKAMEIAANTVDSRIEKVTALRNRFIDGALKIERSRLNGDRDMRLCGNANVCFEGIEGESLLLMLDMQGICASSGSACTSGSLDPSHVLLAIGLPHEIAHGSLRITLTDENTIEDVDYILEKLPPIVDRLRQMSPLWEKIKKEENK
ncbi:MAG: cysteine desulfurase NifS [Clostridia bacterium]|nr:cysteine desulfurase NifS [Clostridia bacterium]